MNGLDHTVKRRVWAEAPIIARSPATIATVRCRALRFRFPKKFAGVSRRLSGVARGGPIVLRDIGLKSKSSAFRGALDYATFEWKLKEAQPNFNAARKALSGG